MKITNSGFTREQRSTFGYWFAHWCAYQMTALNLHAWKFKYLFHDIEKPWLRLFMGYDKVQRIHRRNNKHHLAYKNPEKIDWEALAIDWECSRYTKVDSPKTAMEEFDEKYYGIDLDKDVWAQMIYHMPYTLKRLGLWRD